MNNQLNAREYLSKTGAAGELLSIPESMDMVTAFDTACESIQALHKQQIFLNAPFDINEGQALKEQLNEHKDVLDNTLTTYSEYLKRGITILSIDARIQSHANDWDMDMLATIGLNTSYPQQVKGIEVRFDMVTLNWVDEDGMTWIYDEATGLPVR